MLSSQPITSSTYFQVKIVQLLSTESPDYAKYEHKGSGLFVSVSKTKQNLVTTHCQTKRTVYTTGQIRQIETLLFVSNREWETSCEGIVKTK
jgi:hypothetical protein